MEHLSNDHEDHLNQHKNSQKVCNELGHLFWVYWKVNGNWDNNMIRISQCWESHCRTNTGVRRKKEIQKSRTVRITIKNLGRKVTHLSKVIWDRKIKTEFTRSISSNRISEPVVMMEIESPKTNTLADGVIKRTSSC